MGANYGEILFFTTYPPKTRIIGIEANQDLQVYLERSRAVHPNHDQIELVCAVASNQQSDRTRFSVPTEWSGRGTARVLPNEEGIVIQTVPSITLDSLFVVSETKAAALLFKIDVEGHEPRVLEGMLNLLDSCELALGIVEFNPSFLGEYGIRLDDYVNRLRSRFQLYPVDRYGTIQDLDPSHLDSGANRITDLVLASHPAIAQKIGVVT